ncbi:Collagen-like protein 7 [Stylophora pistillata]|uniref:Collagen-like protein 7 n=1 Tax=Stylophora pistillata TaxID=50429 RepID=A0A2B4SB24_STYPI|nr:Collagen-like protein 7 [Stylophora pistillata]
MMELIRVRRVTLPICILYKPENSVILLSANLGSEREQRFRTPITASECEKFDKIWVSDASRWKWAWVLKVFEEWKKQRNEAVLKQDYSGEAVIQQDIDEMSDEMLDFTLARFVAEVRKEDGQEKSEYCKSYEYVTIDPQNPMVTPARGTSQRITGYEFVLDSSNEAHPFDWYNAYFTIDFYIHIKTSNNQYVLELSNGVFCPQERMEPDKEGNYKHFDLEGLDGSECLAEFGYQKRDIPILADVMGLSDSYIYERGTPRRQNVFLHVTDKAATAGNLTTTAAGSNPDSNFTSACRPRSLPSPDLKMQLLKEAQRPVKKEPNQKGKRTTAGKEQAVQWRPSSRYHFVDKAIPEFDIFNWIKRMKVKTFNKVTSRDEISKEIKKGFDVINLGDKADTANMVNKGLQGGKRDKGDKGDKGDTDLLYPRPKGDTASSSLQGVKGGNTGTQGAKGDTGAQSLKEDIGSQGLQGARSLKGDKGDMGTKGPTGDAGSAFNVSSNVHMKNYKIEIMASQSSGDDAVNNIFIDAIANDILTGVEKFRVVGVAVSFVSVVVVGRSKDGEQGPPRTQETPGLIGMKGDRSDIGPQGPQVIQGPKGDKGPRGNIGPQGVKGNTGNTEPQGNSGSQRPRGNTGSQGRKGNVGPYGIQGPRGLKGVKGDKRDNCNIGPTGPQENTGPQEKAGLQGPTGAQEPHGVNGDTGDKDYKGDSDFKSDGSVAITGNLDAVRASSILPILRPFFSENREKPGGGPSTPGNNQSRNQFVIWSLWVDPLNWQSFIEIGEMACITTAWSSRGHLLKDPQPSDTNYATNVNFVNKTVSDNNTVMQNDYQTYVSNQINTVIKADESKAITGNLDVRNSKIVNIHTPTDNNDAVNKSC